MKYKYYYWASRLLSLFGVHGARLARADIHPSCTIAATTYIEAQSGSVTVGEKSTLHSYAMIIANGGNISVGAGLSLNPFCILYGGRAGLTIGDNVRIASHTVIIPENHNIDRLDVPIRFQGTRSKGVIIGSDVWIGTGVRILDGAVIGRGCVIGAGSVVIDEIPPFSVAVGVPAKVIKSRR
jgi:acetyltransferase-like isoleucine patch superfamily enzyme